MVTFLIINNHLVNLFNGVNITKHVKPECGLCPLDISKCNRWQQAKKEHRNRQGKAVLWWLAATFKQHKESRVISVKCSLSVLATEPQRTICHSRGGPEGSHLWQKWWAHFTRIPMQCTATRPITSRLRGPICGQALWVRGGETSRQN